MLVLAGVFLVALALPELVDLSEDVLTAIEGVVWLIWGVFAFELLAKTYLAPDRRRYLMTHWPDVVVVARWLSDVDGFIRKVMDDANSRGASDRGAVISSLRRAFSRPASLRSSSTP